jgi:uncharacterized protein with beta-barrel porin domain
MKIVNIALVAGTLFIAGCVSTTATMIGGSVAPLAATLQPEQIVIYRSAEQVGKPFREIAIMNSTGESTFTDVAQFHVSMQKKAAALGANAVILGTTREPSTGAEIAGAFLGTGARRKSDSIAIFVDGLEAPPAKLKKK